MATQLYDIEFMKFRFLTLILFLNTLSAFSQFDPTLWQKVSIKHSLNSGITLTHEFHARERVSEGRFALGIYRPWITKKYSKIHTVQFSPIAVVYRNVNGKTQLEWRSSMWNEWKLNYGKVDWLNRVGVEGRLVGDQTQVRVRGRLGVKYSLKRSSLLLTDEQFFNTNLKNHLRQNWLTGQWDITIFQRHKVQLGVQYIIENSKYKNTLFYTGLGFSL